MAKNSFHQAPEKRLVNTSSIIFHICTNQKIINWPGFLSLTLRLTYVLVYLFCLPLMSLVLIILCRYHHPLLCPVCVSLFVDNVGWGPGNDMLMLSPHNNWPGCTLALYTPHTQESLSVCRSPQHISTILRCREEEVRICQYEGQSEKL